MFWKYNLVSGSRLDTLLDKEDVTLKEVMDEDDVLQECKAQTKKLLDFLVRPDVMNEMVLLITQEPSEEIDEKQRYKYSYIACELLTFDISQINDALVNDDTIITKLFNFLNTNKALNPLLASFFSKTFGLLISRKTEFVFNFLQDKDFIALLIKHLDTSAIMDLLLRCTSIDDNEKRNMILKWLKEKNLIEHLIALIDVAHSEEVICNASHALCDIIKASREHMSILQEKADPEPLLEALESTEIISNLLDHMLRDVSKESAIVNGISVLLALLEFKKPEPIGARQLPSNQNSQPIQAEIAPQSFVSPFLRNNGPEQMTALDAERLSHSVNNVVAAILPRLEDFHNLLENPPAKPAITLTYGTLAIPLGFCRLEIAHLINALLSTNNHKINIKLASLGTVMTLMDLFFKYSWNNFLHTQVEQAIGRIITNNPTIDNEGNKVHPLLDQLIIHYQITNKILDNWDSDSATSSKGYIGHLTKIANHISQNIENGINSAMLQEKIKELPADLNKQWDEFVTEKLAEINRKNTTHLVGGPVSTPLSANDDESIDFRNVPFGRERSSLQLAFADAYQVHEMTSNFVDQFGFNDEEFGNHDETLIYSQGSLNPLASNFHVGGENVRSAELFEEFCRKKDSVLWDDKDHASFSNCFRLNKSTEDNSSDSDEESQVFETETTSIVLNSEEIKMEVDHQEGIFGVPMDVAPAAMNNPWESAEASNSTSGDQENWADFSNFASFGASTAESTNIADSTISVAMETSENISSAVKCVPNSSEAIISEIDFSKKNPLAADTLGSQNENESSGDSLTISEDANFSKTSQEIDNGSKASNRQKDITAFFDEETCSATSIPSDSVEHKAPSI